MSMNYLEIVFFSCCYNDVYFISFLVSLQRKCHFRIYLALSTFVSRISGLKLCVWGNTLHIVKS